MSANAIDIAGLTVYYGQNPALTEVSFSLEPGQVCAVVGMNGSGKSTLFNTIMGLVPASAGRVAVCGVSPAVARRAGTVAYAPQSEKVDWDFPVSVRDVVAMGRYRRKHLTRRLNSADREAVAEAIENAGLAELANRPIARLSGGQRKRVFVARAMAQSATVVLLDEPFAGVDVSHQQQLIEILQGLSSQGATIMISTHDLDGVRDLADTTMVLRNRIVAFGRSDDVLTPRVLGQAFGLGETND